MSVVSVNEVADGRSAGENQDTRTSTRRFIVELSDATDNPQEARDAIGVPQMNEENPNDPNTFVLGKDTEETGNRKVWFVVVNYSTRATSDANDPSGGQDPLKENPSIVWTTRDIEVVATQGTLVERGNFGGGIVQKEVKVDVPITNSAGDLYTDPPLVIPDFLQVCTIKRNERPRTQFNPANVRARLNTINTGGARVAGISFKDRQGWLIKYDGAQIQQREGIDYVPVTYQIMVARPEKNWEDKILDQGLREKMTKADGTVVLVDIPGANGKRVTTPVNLDGAGLRLKEGADPVFLSYLTKAELNFSLLQLPREYSRTGR